MLEAPPIITHVEAQDTAVVRLTIARSAIQSMMGPAIAEVRAALKAQGLSPAGPVFSHHFVMHPDTFDFEVGVPVATPVSPAGRVMAGQLPAGRVARAVHQGGYEALGASWGGLLHWVKAHGFKTAPDLWEVYLAGPDAHANPRNWRTELNKPLVD
jgi:effector-binding domain-containing protein